MNLIQKLFAYLASILIAISPSPQYIEGVVGQPQSFLPNQTISETEKTISSLIYRSLFEYDIYGALVPDLVEAWSVSEDGISYTIKLKANQYWSDGKPITSDDLIYTSFKVADLSGVATDKVDDLTVIYTLPNKYSPFLSLLTIGVMPINAEETNNKLKPISSDDFKVIQIERVGDVIQRITLTSTNEDHKIKRVAFKFYSNEDELATAAKLGEIDAFLAKETYELENFDNKHFPLQGIYYALVFNLRNETLQNVELRQKLQKVLPVTTLIAEQGIVVQGPISRSLFTDKDLNFTPYDSEFREDLGDIKLTLTVPNSQEHIDLANQLKELWHNRLDLNLEIITVSADQMLSQVIEPRNFEILLYGQEIGRDPDRYVYWHSTQKDAPGLNISGFEQVRADRALEEGRNEQDNEKRVIHYNEFQKVVTEQVPTIFLYHPYTNFYVTKYIKGVGEKYTFTYADRFLDFSNWEKVQTN